MRTIDFEKFINFHANYQRNGICGEGFFSFHWYDAEEKQNFIATCHEWKHAEGVQNAGCYAVVSIDDPRACWRGDWFIDDLRRAFEAYVSVYGDLAPHQHEAA